MPSIEVVSKNGPRKLAAKINSIPSVIVFWMAENIVLFIKIVYVINEVIKDKIYISNLLIISLLFMRMSSFFSCSLNQATKDRTDDIIVTSRCWTTTFVFPVLWTMFCRAFLPLLSSAHAIMTRAFFFTSSSAIWNPLPTTKGQIISVLLKPSELDFVRLAFSCEGFI